MKEVKKKNLKKNEKENEMTTGKKMKNGSLKMKKHQKYPNWERKPQKGNKCKSISL